MPLLRGKKALVTGATAGIGKAIAAAFASEGASVVVCGTNAERAAEVIDLLTGSRIDPAQQFKTLILDVANKPAVDKALQELLAEWGGVDILVNNAGIARDGLLMKMSEQDWDLVIDTNLKSVFNFCQALVRPMLKAKKGKIINISSVVGLTGNGGQVNYAASKSGMIGLTKSLALEVASRGICVNCIAPGFIQTKMTDALTEAQKTGILETIPMGRMGDPMDIAHAAVFLASHLSDYMTGQVLAIDGGMVMR